MTVPVKEERKVIPLDAVERAKIVDAGRMAATGGLPGMLNPYRDPDRRAAWDEGYGGQFGNSIKA